MEAISASGISLVVRGVSLVVRGFALLVRSEVGKFQLQQRGVRAVVATAQRLVVFRNGAGNILLGIQRIAVYFVITAGEASRRALCQSLDGIVRLALVDQNTREPKARDLLEFRILGVGHDLRQRGDGFGGLVAFDVDARNRQLCLVGIGRIGIVLDDPVRNLLGFLAIVHL